MKRIEPPFIYTEEELLTSFHEGEIKKLPWELVFKEFVSSWNFDRFSNELGQCKISRHLEFDGNTFKPSWQPLSLLCNDLMKCDHIPDPGTKERMFHYGVTNSKRINLNTPVKSSLLKNFSQSFSFVWVGLSPGGLHCDYYNNILYQISGTKLITIYPPKYSNSISDNHYISLHNKSNIHAKENLESFPGLSNPCVQVLLKPGDAIMIPCASYHAPKALSTDSISINAFLTPKFRTQFLNQYSRKEDNYPWWFTNASIAFSKRIFQLTGKPTLRTGHYEVM